MTAKLASLIRANYEGFYRTSKTPASWSFYGGNLTFINSFDTKFAACPFCFFLITGCFLSLFFVVRTEKSSFNYLLIDPRVTQNLPVRAKKMPNDDTFKVFIMSIFYVGKGKRSRPYAHLNEALQSSKVSENIAIEFCLWNK